jgi:DNA-binding response OmpR family regulator
MLFTESECKTLRAKKCAHAASQRKPNAHKHILVVEDDSILRRLNTEALICSGYQVDAADGGVAAWDALQVNNYDLVITDNNMPKVTGVELLGKMQAAGFTVPVIMATGTVPTAEFEKSPWLQPDAMLVKPYSLDELVDTVRNLLSATAAVPLEIAGTP